ncbi:MAG: glutathione S-transferase, partial [Novosphingobium sp.]
IVWLCEELGLPYELRSYARDPSGAAPPEYKALHPFGTAPVIEDGSLVLGESGAIVEYLCMRHGGGRLVVTPEHADYPDYLFWFHFANGSMVPGFMIDYMTAAAGGTGAGAPNQGPSRSERAIALADARLGQVPYFAGSSFTAADIMMCLPRFCETRDLSGCPNITAYLERIGERPAWQRTAQLR